MCNGNSSTDSYNGCLTPIQKVDQSNSIRETGKLGISNDSSFCTENLHSPNLS